MLTQQSLVHCFITLHAKFQLLSILNQLELKPLAYSKASEGENLL